MFNNQKEKKKTLELLEFVTTFGCILIPVSAQ